jgi:hypothetical protein
VPARPKASGITLLLKLIVIERMAMASPCRSGGVIWCKVLMIIGCTAPSASPSSVAQPAISQGVPANG